MSSPNPLEQLARLLQQGDLSLQDFLSQATAAQSLQLNDTTLDLDRERRCGYPEVIFGEGKTVETLTEIFRSLRQRGTDVFATRIDTTKAEQLCEIFPTGQYHTSARTFRIPNENRNPDQSEIRSGHVAVVTAGTSDLPVADEAAETLDWMGVEVTRIHDVGVAGPHRLPEHVEVLRNCDAIVVVAGLEGALPSVVGGYVACPVVAVPTSVGYGASFGGVAALLGMLNSCASNVTVVNIDAGFKGGYVAGLIAARADKNSRGDETIESDQIAARENAPPQDPPQQCNTEPNEREPSTS
jgi:NCAIR mutase (PurE)-related protein